MSVFPRFETLRAASGLLVFLLLPGVGVTATVTPADSAHLQSGDQWLSPAGQFPVFVETNRIHQLHFASLGAAVVAGRMKILWTPEPSATNTSVTLFASADAPGHWPARDWRSYPMNYIGGWWEAAVPVDSVETPIVYFVQSDTPTGALFSPMRACVPQDAGMETPSRPFWPFLSGFETGTEGWHLKQGRADNPPLRTGTPARQGKNALIVTLPEGQRSVTIGTTRIRGRHIRDHDARGLRLWMRTQSGDGRARFTLFAHAFSPDQKVSIGTAGAELNPDWQRIDLPFSGFPNLPLGGVDWLAIELSGNGPMEFLLDDVQLLGPWRLELD